MHRENKEKDLALKKRNKGGNKLFGMGALTTQQKRKERFCLQKWVSLDEKLEIKGRKRVPVLVAEEGDDDHVPSHPWRKKS